MKVFVTGATGLVGSFVLRELLRGGNTPVILLRKNTSRVLIQDTIHLCEIVEGDILDVFSLKQGMSGCDVVIHCAGMVSFDPRKEKEIYKINVVGTANVVNASLEMGVGKLIHLSSIAAIGRSTHNANVNESTQWSESKWNSYYATSKYLAELEVFRGGEEGLNFSIVNPSIVLGPGERHRSSTQLFTQIIKLPYFHPKGFLNVVDVRDVAKSACFLLKVEHQDRLILNGAELTYKELYTYVRLHAGIKGPLIPVPKMIIRLIAAYERIKSFIVSKEPLVTRESVRAMNTKIVYSSLFYPVLFPNNPFVPVQESTKWVIENLSGEK
jgi:nucleoside-diphosphate-sugar epimerase